MTKARSARDVAAGVLVRVMRDQAFAAAALEADLEGLDPRDRALATELVYGTLRVLPWIIALLDSRAKKPTKSLPWDAQGALWIAVQQIHFMRVPAFAAVDEAVSAVRRAAGQHVAGFANAMLRRIAEAASRGDDDLHALRVRALYESCPADLRKALTRALGDEGARSFLSDTETPQTGLRVRDAKDRANRIARISEARPSSTLIEGKLSPLCILARGVGKPQSLPGYAEGEISVQEEGSQVVALALGARAGERVLDACAGRGNKASLIALEGAKLDACDRDPRKLERLTEDLARVRADASLVRTFAVDWTVGSGDVSGEYDAILVDAPCSGVGTLRRRPELALRTMRPLSERTTTQRAIALGAARHLAPGGRLVYAVCSVLSEEAEDVTSAFAAASLEPAPFSDEHVNAIAKGASSLRLLPYIHGCDGYFLASFRKR